MVEKIFKTLCERSPIMHEMSSYQGKWSYDYGVILMGIRRLYEQEKDQRYLDYMLNNLSPLIDSDGTIHDYKLTSYNINNGKILFTLYQATGDQKYKIAMDTLFEQLQGHPRTSQGAFWHKQIYPWQIWLDGLYMGAPFYAEYLLTFCGGEGLADVLRQFELSYEHTYDGATGLLMPGWDEARAQDWCDKETGRSAHAWGRAMGWYMMALIDTIELLPLTYAGRESLVNIFQATAASLCKYQQPNGVWYQVIDCPDRHGNYYEASGSSMFTAAIGRGILLGVLDRQRWLPIEEKAWRGLLREFVFETKEGWMNLRKNCMVAGLGGADNRDGSFVYYISEPVIANDNKGYGAFLQAAIVAEKLGLKGDFNRYEL